MYDDSVPQIDQGYEELLGRFKRLLAQFVPDSPQHVDASTRINHDVGLSGDDAEEFLHAFSEQFRVDLTDFNFNRYFADEPHLLTPLFAVIRLVRTVRIGREPLPVERFIRAVQCGKWREREHVDRNRHSPRSTDAPTRS